MKLSPERQLMKQQYQRHAIESLVAVTLEQFRFEIWQTDFFLNGATDIFWSEIVSHVSLAILSYNISHWKQQCTHQNGWLFLKLKWEKQRKSLKKTYNFTFCLHKLEKKRNVRAITHYSTRGQATRFKHGQDGRGVYSRGSSGGASSNPTSDTSQFLVPLRIKINRVNVNNIYIFPLVPCKKKLHDHVHSKK